MKKNKVIGFVGVCAFLLVVTGCSTKDFVHEVPHVCPIHTRIINHHVFKHTYRPAYTCSEENVCTNVQCGSCCQFK